jgi:hypothetical protein
MIEVVDAFLSNYHGEAWQWQQVSEIGGGALAKGQAGALLSGYSLLS